MVLYTKPPKIVEGSGSPFEQGNAIALPLFEGSEPDESLPAEVVEALKLALDTGVASTKPGSLAKIPSSKGLLLACGAGPRGDLEGVRRCFAAAARQAVESFKTLHLHLDGLSQDEAREAVIAAALGAYRLEEFKNTRKRKLETIIVYGFNGSLSELEAIAEGVYLARDVANAPPHRLPPPRLAEAVKELFSGFENIEVEVLAYERLVEEGFGGIVNVGRGSDEKPRLVVIKYHGGGGEPIALVGKTVVFDSGGINLKPSQGMVSMRADKAGGAAVLGAMWTLARLGVKSNIVALIPAVINVPSGTSYLPSDVIRMWDGTLVEITNTDAEGRLILADAIAYAAEKLGAKVIVDLATLTGAIVVALGPLVAGLFTRSDELARIFEEASKATGEKIWRMPMEDEYAKSMTQPAQVGEIVNAAQRYGGAIFAALFLEKFAHGKPHVHLDIAGPGIAFEAGSLTPPYWPEKGLAPGYGVRLVVEAVRRLSYEGGGGGSG